MRWFDNFGGLGIGAKFWVIFSGECQRDWDTGEAFHYLVSNSRAGCGVVVEWAVLLEQDKSCPSLKKVVPPPPGILSSLF